MGLPAKSHSMHLAPVVVPPPLALTARWRAGPFLVPGTPPLLTLLAKGRSGHAAIAEASLPPASPTRSVQGTTP